MQDPGKGALSDGHAAGDGEHERTSRFGLHLSIEESAKRPNDFFHLGYRHRLIDAFEQSQGGRSHPVAAGIESRPLSSSE
jgi:hypothetical protein